MQGRLRLFELKSRHRLLHDTTRGPAEKQSKQVCIFTRCTRLILNMRGM